MSSMGYRVKLDEYLSSFDEYKTFLKEYFSYFQICEVKINKFLNNLEYNTEYISYLLDMFSNKISFHFNKNIIRDCEFGKLEQYIIDYTNRNSATDDIYCITHLKSTFMDETDTDKMEYLNNLFYKSNSIVFENPKLDVDSLDYFENVSNIFHTLEQKGISPKMCIDWGHLLINNQNIESLINKIINEDLKKYIVEHHIHDVRNGIDHQPLCDGYINYKPIYSFIENMENEQRIILECNVNEISKDGVDNVRALRRLT